MSYPRHRVGDIVRLAKGWTPMTVIGLTPDNEVIAQYGTNPDREDLRHPKRALSTYTRPDKRLAREAGVILRKLTAGEPRKLNGNMVFNMPPRVGEYPPASAYGPDDFSR